MDYQGKKSGGFLHEAVVLDGINLGSNRNNLILAYPYLCLLLIPIKRCLTRKTTDIEKLFDRSLLIISICIL
jgi:hypothetical protein